MINEREIHLNFYPMRRRIRVEVKRKTFMDVVEVEDLHTQTGKCEKHILIERTEHFRQNSAKVLGI